MKPSKSDEIKNLAKEAAQEIVNVASVAARALAATTSADIGYIKRDIAEVKIMLDQHYITKDQFNPVQKIAYGFVALVMLTVVGALLSMVILKR